MDKPSPIAVLGAGAWGLSTALHLVESGHTNITVFERASSAPSPYSAANDLNKIIRAEYEDPFYTNLTLEAIQAWKTPLFGPQYHQTGYINCTSGRAPQKSIETLTKNLKSVAGNSAFANETQILREKKDFNKYAWALTGNLTGFKGYFNRLAGYAHSGDTLGRLQRYCVSKGVRFLMGEKIGKVEAVQYDASGRCTGVRTADGRVHNASLTVCALGANAASIIPEIGKFAVARCWSVVHIQLTEDEASLLRNIPVVNVRDLGFFFEPDPVTRLFKLCPLGAGYTNTGSDGLSLPPQDITDDGWGGFVPPEDERKLRTLLRETLPWLADRPFVDNKFCWFSDTADSEYCVDFVPGTLNSLIVLSGDSGHGFKMTPIVGKWVLELLAEGCQKLPRWQWKSGVAQEAWGDAVSWRVGTAKEIGDLVKEQQRVEGARL
ncbi:amino acid transporter [Paramyrothecium foliicola]|nr:amino acid transporter [Paramyrothecium foliicola]